MSLILNLTPESEDKLRELATQRGEDPAVYAEEVIEDHLRFQPTETEDNDGRDYLAEAIQRMVSRTPEERNALAAEVFRTARPGRPLPPGKTSWT